MSKALVHTDHLIKPGSPHRVQGRPRGPADFSSSSNQERNTCLTEPQLEPAGIGLCPGLMRPADAPVSVLSSQGPRLAASRNARRFVVSSLSQ